MPPFSALYIEDQCRNIPSVQRIIKTYPDIPRISCGHYEEVFNRKAQNFRWQKRNPGLILAKKQRHCVLPAPPGYGFGNQHSYYFSHMLNCLYDCRYCFLQGMYRSAHYVLFVNYDDFAREIEQTIQSCGNTPSYFYSGYDCDSLVFEPLSRFVAYFLPFFKRYPHANLELRTKSTQIRLLLKHEPIRNCIIAMSFSPENVSKKLEKGVPSVFKRIAVLKKLQQQGWPIALRFEPLIYHVNYQAQYQRLFERIFSVLDPEKLHSVSLGFFRMPQTFFSNIVKIYPDEPLFAGHYVVQKGMTSYPPEIEDEMIVFCESRLLEHVPRHIYYRCKEEDKQCGQ